MIRIVRINKNLASPRATVLGAEYPDPAGGAWTFRILLHPAVSCGFLLDCTSCHQMTISSIPPSSDLVGESEDMVLKESWRLF
jgi:hypothetical protein